MRIDYEPPLPGEAPDPYYDGGPVTPMSTTEAREANRFFRRRRGRRAAMEAAAHADTLLARRLAWEREHPRPESLRQVERMVVQGLNAYGFGRQYQVTREDGFEIAVDDLVITVRRDSEAE